MVNRFVNETEQRAAFIVNWSGELRKLDKNEFVGEVTAVSTSDIRRLNTLVSSRDKRNEGSPPTHCVITSGIAPHTQASAISQSRPYGDPFTVSRWRFVGFAGYVRSAADDRRRTGAFKGSMAGSEAARRMAEVGHQRMFSPRRASSD